MTIYIYNAEAFEKENYELIDSFTAETNQECEDWASENYSDSDYYAWSYTKG